jgi:lauroyl/myristoyl acyltransferase
VTRAELYRLLVEASRHAPVPSVLRALRVLGRFVTVERPAPARIGEKVFGLRGPALREFCRRAWWGAKASDVLAARLDAARGVDGVVARADFSRVADAVRVGRGVILAGAHVGPSRVAASLIRDRFPETLFLAGQPWPGPEPARVLLAFTPEERRAVLAAAHLELRRGGLVHVTPDGAFFARQVTVPLRAGHVPIARGVATLARRSGAIALPVAATWSRGRVVVDVAPPIAPRAAEPDAWELEWLAIYLAFVDRWTAAAPENVRFKGSVFERWQPGAPWSPSS